MRGLLLIGVVYGFLITYAALVDDSVKVSSRWGMAFLGLVLSLVLLCHMFFRLYLIMVLCLFQAMSAWIGLSKNGRINFRHQTVKGLIACLIVMIYLKVYENLFYSLKKACS